MSSRHDTLDGAIEQALTGTISGARSYRHLIDNVRGNEQRAATQKAFYGQLVRIADAVKAGNVDLAESYAAEARSGYARHNQDTAKLSTGQADVDAIVEHTRNPHHTSATKTKSTADLGPLRDILRGAATGRPVTAADLEGIQLGEHVDRATFNAAVTDYARRANKAHAEGANIVGRRIATEAVHNLAGMIGEPQPPNLDNLGPAELADMIRR
jgi:hypothetical protein